ncbi:MAG TPA: hypothetical protein VHF26_08185, partial [Trebonia sp.]|nr:hypothetical protein [Trebonia sp.]
RRLALAGGGAGALAVGLTVGLGAFGGTGSPAYAVTQQPDGTLTVAVKQLSAVPSANKKLRSLGQLGQRVVLVPVKAGCPSIDSLPAPKVSPATTGQSSSGKVPAGTAGGNVQVNQDGSAAVRAQNIPAGDIEVLAVAVTGHTVHMADRLTSPPAPSCVSLPPSRTGGQVRTLPSGHKVRTGAGQDPGPVTPKSGSGS